MRRDVRCIGCGCADGLTIMQYLNKDGYIVSTLFACSDCAAEFRGKAIVVTEQKAGINEGKTFKRGGA